MSPLTFTQLQHLTRQNAKIRQTILDAANCSIARKGYLPVPGSRARGLDRFSYIDQFNRLCKAMGSNNRQNIHPVARSADGQDQVVT